jgi:cysteinyl-tRNA synthetase
MVVDPVAVPAAVMNALCDDLNTPQVIAELNGLLHAENSPGLKAQLLAAGAVLGLFENNPASWLGLDQDVSLFDDLLAERTQARKDKNFKRSDEIRDVLLAQGYVIEDTPQGPKLRKN